jgi:hypothetical protein
MLARFIGSPLLPYEVVVNITDYHGPDHRMADVVYHNIHHLVYTNELKLLNKEGNNMKYPKFPFEATYTRVGGRYPVGTKFTVTKKINSEYVRIEHADGREDEIALESITPIIRVVVTKESLEKEIAIKAEEIKELENKLAYLQQSGTDGFDENEYTIFSTITVMEEPKLTKLEKVKSIKKLLKLV